MLCQLFKALGWTVWLQSKTPTYTHPAGTWLFFSQLLTKWNKQKNKMLNLAVLYHIISYDMHILKLIWHTQPFPWSIPASLHYCDKGTLGICTILSMLLKWKWYTDLLMRCCSCMNTKQKLSELNRNRWSLDVMLW